jgi:hypothetical protein
LLSVVSKALSGLGLVAGLTSLIRPAGYRLLPAALCTLCLAELLFVGKWGRPPGPREQSVTSPMILSLREASSRPQGASEWAVAGAEAVQIQDVRLTVPSVLLANFTRKDLAKGKAQEVKYLVIELRISHVSKSPFDAVIYAPWTDLPKLPSDHPPTLTDQLQRAYTQIALAPGQPFERREPETVLAAGRELREILVYPAPPADVEYLHLDLPAEAFSLPGRFRFRIPRAFIQSPTSKVREAAP